MARFVVDRGDLGPLVLTALRRPGRRRCDPAAAVLQGLPLHGVDAAVVLADHGAHTVAVAHAHRIGEDHRPGRAFHPGLVDHRAAVVGEGQVTTDPGLHPAVPVPVVGGHIESAGSYRLLARTLVLTAPGEQGESCQNGPMDGA